MENLTRFESFFLACRVQNLIEKKENTLINLSKDRCPNLKSKLKSDIDYLIKLRDKLERMSDSAISAKETV